MDTRRSECKDDKEFRAQQVRYMSLENYNKLLTSRRWYNKDPKYALIMSLVGVAQKLAYDSNKSSDKSNTFKRESTKGYTAYIRYPPPWIL